MKQNCMHYNDTGEGSISFSYCTHFFIRLKEVKINCFTVQIKMPGGLTMFPYMTVRVVLHPKQVAVMRNSFCLQSSFWLYQVSPLIIFRPVESKVSNLDFKICKVKVNSMMLCFNPLISPILQQRCMLDLGEVQSNVAKVSG